MDIRVGFGYDVHRLVPERELILGGVKIDFDMGLLGHSDADVLLHAICDAILGAAALGDIGRHFPDTDERYRGISSVRLLQNVVKKTRALGFIINNVDATIVAQKPRLSPFIPAMKDNISSCIRIDQNRVNIKATTTEGLGFAGQGLGIASYSICSLIKRD